jgi:hypothetical protein
VILDIGRLATVVMSAQDDTLAAFNLSWTGECYFTMAKGPTKQHYVPRCYLAGWVDLNTPTGQEPYVWVFNRGERKGRKRAPSNLFTETDLYTLRLQTGEKIYAIEETLSSLESRYATIFQEKIRKHLPLGEEEHILLCAFVSVMLQRTLRHRDNIGRFMAELIEHTEALERAHEIPPDESNRLKRFKLDAHKLGMMRNLPDVTQLLTKMSIAFLCAERGSKFVTSDDPCNLFNPDLQWQRIYSPGLAQANVSLTLPLSPDMLLCMSWMPMRGYIRWSKAQVEEANRMTIGHCYSYFVSHSPKTRRHWFRRYPLDFFFILKILRHQAIRGWHRLNMWYRYRHVRKK